MVDQDKLNKQAIWKRWIETNFTSNQYENDESRKIYKAINSKMV